MRARVSLHRLAFSLALAAGLALVGGANADSQPPGYCHAGAYALADGSSLIVSPSDGPNLRYRKLDGTAGKLFPTSPDHYAGGIGWSAPGDAVRVDFEACGADGVSVAMNGAPAVAGSRIALPTRPMTFQSGDLSLYGELVLPVSGSPQAVVVLQYGSDPESAVWNNYLQHLLPLNGIAVLVFDKRGTGRSQGVYSADFGELSDDMAAAVLAVRRQPGLGDAPVGLLGESQGGWVVPLTAVKTPVDFVIADYGLAVPITEEDRSEMIQDLHARRFDDPETLAKAEGFQRAAIRLAASHFAEGRDEVAALQARYQAEPWFKGLRGDITGMVAATPPEGLDAIARIFSFKIDLTYDPRPVIARVDAPMLWVLAGRDTGAPHEATLAIVRELQARGQAIDIAVFPNAEHGIIELAPDGSRAGRQSPGYLDLLSDWIRTRSLAGRPYGAAILYERSRSPQPD